MAVPGCTYFITDKKKLKELIDTGNFLWIDTHYAYHKWWEFWKYNKVTGYTLMCIKDIKASN